MVIHDFVALHIAKNHIDTMDCEAKIETIECPDESTAKEFAEFLLQRGVPIRYKSFTDGIATFNVGKTFKSLEEFEEGDSHEV